MNKNLNWISEFMQTQKQEKALLRVNKTYLKNNNLFRELDFCTKSIKNFDSVVVDFSEDLRVFSNELNDLIDYYNKLEKKVNIQKGRITRQTNEQNREKAALENAFKEVYSRLGVLENGINHN